MDAHWLQSSKGGGRSRRATSRLGGRSLVRHMRFEPWIAFQAFNSIPAIHHSPFALCLAGLFYAASTASTAGRHTAICDFGRKLASVASVLFCALSFDAAASGSSCCRHATHRSEKGRVVVIVCSQPRFTSRFLWVRACLSVPSI